MFDSQSIIFIRCWCEEYRRFLCHHESNISRTVSNSAAICSECDKPATTEQEAYLQKSWKWQTIRMYHLLCKVSTSFRLGSIISKKFYSKIPLNSSQRRFSGARKNARTTKSIPGTTFCTSKTSNLLGKENSFQSWIDSFGKWHRPATHLLSTHQHDRKFIFKTWFFHFSLYKHRPVMLQLSRIHPKPIQCCGKSSI